MLDNTLATYITTIQEYCSTPEDISDHVVDLYERLLNLERSKRETTKLLPIKRVAESFSSEVLPLAMAKPEYHIGRNRKKISEASWLAFQGLILQEKDLEKYPKRDKTYINNNAMNIKTASLSSKCLMYWIVNTFETEWMPAVTHWLEKEKIFHCDVPHDLVLRDLRMSEHTWKSFWFNKRFDAEFFDQYILQEIEQGKDIKEETFEQIEQIKILRPSN